MDTIFALATAQGKAGVAIIRISGPQAFVALHHLCGSVPEPRVASLRAIATPDLGLIDRALVLTFREGQSFTGEATVELHLHGSVAVVSAVLTELAKLEGCRIADPGEFTRRALENQRLDLAQVEGLADLVEAETEAQRKQAQRVFEGELGRKVGQWRGWLINAAALLEATIDFVDEEVPVDVGPEVIELIDRVREALRRELDGAVAAERIRQGFEVAIVGPPNIGKSTLLNALAGRDAAITSEIAGTTRDVIEVRMDIGGFAVTLLDTAGLRETDDVVEALGVARGRARAEKADIRVRLFESLQDMVSYPVAGEDDIYLVGKSDLGVVSDAAVSGITEDGIGRLLERIHDKIRLRSSNSGIAIRMRHREAMGRGLKTLELARGILVEDGEHVEIAAEYFRQTIRQLEALTGHIGVETLLDEIFASFCLGK